MSPKNIIAKILFASYLIAVGILCFIHTDKIPDMQKMIFGIPTDKVAHFIMFFPFPILALVSFGTITRKPWHSFIFAIIVFLAGIILAVGTELGQGLTGYRSAESADLFADGLALAISSIIVLIIDLRKQFGK